MTADEWLNTEDTWALMKAVNRAKPSERKVRLFNIAVCRRFWSYLPHESQAILEESEQLADGLLDVSPDNLSQRSDDLCRRANDVVFRAFDQRWPGRRFPSTEIEVQRAASAAVCYAVLGQGEIFAAAGYFTDVDPAERTKQAALLRDIFGNPLRPIVFQASWRTPAAMKLAETIYAERAFEDLPILADALEEAGCADDSVRSHCRRAPLHARGCWVVDLLLGKECHGTEEKHGPTDNSSETEAVVGTIQ